MVDMSNLWNMQGMMFLMVLTGMIFSKIGVITKEGRSCLTKLTINLFIPWQHGSRFPECGSFHVVSDG